MLSKLCLIIGIYGLNICYCAAEEISWNQHVAVGDRLKSQARFPEAEQEYRAAVRTDRRGSDSG